MKKVTAIALASVLGATAIGTTFAVAQSTSDQGFGVRGSAEGQQLAWGEKKGKRGGKGAKMCSAEMADKKAERQAAVDAFITQNLGLTADQLALYDAAKEAKASADAIKAAACESGERPDRSEMKAAMEPAKEAFDTFKESLTDEQEETVELLMPKKGKHGGKGGGKRGYGMERGNQQS